MKTMVLGCALLAAFVGPLPASSDDQFTDTVCEKATPLGRHLNQLVEANGTLTRDLMATALQMRDVYEDCVTGYDRDAASGGGHGGEQFGSSNGALIGRIYSRLALARALQRVAKYFAYDKKFDGATVAYDESLRRLDEIERIEPISNTHPGTPERNIAAKAAELRPALIAGRAELSSASPAPAASSAVPSHT